MLLLAHLMTRHQRWADAQIRLLAAARTTAPDAPRRSLTTLLADYRIDARPVTVDDADADTILDASRDAAVVFMPFRIQGLRLTDPFGGSLERLLPYLPVTALVMAAEDIDLDATPEEGTAGEAADAQDTYEALIRRAAKLEKAAQKDKERVAELRLDLETKGSTAAERGELERELALASETAEESRRRAAKANAKAQNAAAVIEASDEDPEAGED